MEEAFVDGDPFGRVEDENFVEQVLELRHFAPNVVRKSLLSAGEQLGRQIARGLDHRQRGRLLLRWGVSGW